MSQRFKDDAEYTFVLNHNEHPVTFRLGGLRYKDLLTGNEISGQLIVEAKDVKLLECI